VLRILVPKAEEVKPKRIQANLGGWRPSRAARAPADHPRVVLAEHPTHPPAHGPQRYRRGPFTLVAWRGWPGHALPRVTARFPIRPACRMGRWLGGQWHADQGLAGDVVDDGPYVAAAYLVGGELAG
jgi:hypothetical protein